MPASPIKPGEVRNPKGRPKGSRSFRSAMKKVLEADQVEVKFTIDGKEVVKKIKVDNDKYNLYDAIAAVQIQQAVSGDHRAVKDIIDRMEGSASQSIKMEKQVSGEISVKIERRAITSKSDIRKTTTTTTTTTETDFDIDEVF
jgi:hypothetical protein